MNIFLLVGKIYALPDTEEKNVHYFFLECYRNFKNQEGIYEVDIFKIQLWKGLAESTKHIGKVGDQIVVKGRIEGIKKQKDELIYNYVFIAEDISFLN